VQSGVDRCIPLQTVPGGRFELYAYHRLEVPAVPMSLVVRT
jgi:hypothetical protein